MRRPWVSSLPHRSTSQSGTPRAFQSSKCFLLSSTCSLPFTSCSCSRSCSSSRSCSPGSRRWPRSDLVGATRWCSPPAHSYGHLLPSSSLFFSSSLLSSPLLSSSQLPRRRSVQYEAWRQESLRMHTKETKEAGGRRGRKQRAGRQAGRSKGWIGDGERRAEGGDLLRSSSHLSAVWSNSTSTSGVQEEAAEVKHLFPAPSS